MVSGRLGMLFEMACLYFLPARHYSSASADGDSVPSRVEVGVGDCTCELGVGGEGDEVVTIELVVVVCHCVNEAADDGFRDVCVVGISVVVRRGKTWITYLCFWAVSMENSQ